ncbi:MAG TPA: class I SAM-dependent rRNA methyltransferase [Clostridia bacterium]|nr:class I SAM-dependent rRNA methyltransferase [Clostridia bacterium]
MSPRGAARLRSGHVWVYQSDIKSARNIAPASTVSVYDDHASFYGTALYSSTSQIAIRMLGSQAIPAERTAEVVAERVRAAIHYRRNVVRDTNAYRVVFSEADFLPGLIVDRYNDMLSLQVLTQAMDQAPVREAVLRELVQELDPVCIVERVEPRIRELEQLPPLEGGVIWTRDGAQPKSSTTFTMNGLRFQYDAHGGQKTGAFLDQRENYSAAERYAHGRALDVFCYQGGFALHLARTCEQVTGVDASRPALEIANQNAALNAGLYNGREIEWVEANAFDLLRDYSDGGEEYDTVVLDPPAFAKTKRTLDTAVRGYKELNLRALKMVKAGGVLVTCSCSYHVSEAEFLQMLTSAAVDARRQVRILEKRVQAQDHPVLLTVPETSYLKCIICQIT